MTSGDEFSVPDQHSPSCATAKRWTLCLAFRYRSAGESNRLRTKPGSGERGAGNKEVCNARVVLPERQQQLSLTLQQLYLGWLFCGTVECKPVNSISTAVERGKNTKLSQKYEAGISAAPGRGCVEHLPSLPSPRGCLTHCTMSASPVPPPRNSRPVPAERSHSSAFAALVPTSAVICSNRPPRYGLPPAFAGQSPADPPQRAAAAGGGRAGREGRLRPTGRPRLPRGGSPRKAARLRRPRRCGRRRSKAAAPTSIAEPPRCPRPGAPALLRPTRRRGGSSPGFKQQRRQKPSERGNKRGEGFEWERERLGKCRGAGEPGGLRGWGGTLPSRGWASGQHGPVADRRAQAMGKGLPAAGSWRLGGFSPRFKKLEHKGCKKAARMS